MYNMFYKIFVRYDAMETINVIMFHITFVVCTFCCTTGSKCVDLYTVGEKDKYFPGEIIEIIYPTGFQHCQKICGKKTSCLSINYNKDQLKCELISTPVNTADVESRTGFVFARKEIPDMCTKLQCSPTSQCFQTKAGNPACITAPSSCARDCQDISDTELSTADTHKICPFGDGNPVEVKCNVIGSETWTIIQRRFDGSVDFFRSWEEYKNGFGNAATEYWIGNNILHALTSTVQYKLLVELQNWQGTTATVSYSQFSVGDETSYYKLSLSGFSGDIAGDGMSDDSGSRFSTKDNYDTSYYENCAIFHHSGWWHARNCMTNGNLNGQYGSQTEREENMFWYEWLLDLRSLKSCSIMIRRN